tara:strand:+ start:4165 stop:4458 length:294 start_codon:yes stop_codon:yes gene_type:complete
MKKINKEDIKAIIGVLLFGALIIYVIKKAVSGSANYFDYGFLIMTAYIVGGLIMIIFLYIFIASLENIFPNSKVAKNIVKWTDKTIKWIMNLDFRIP